MGNAGLSIKQLEEEFFFRAQKKKKKSEQDSTEDRPRLLSAGSSLAPSGSARMNPRENQLLIVAMRKTSSVSQLQKLCQIIRPREVSG